MSKIDHCLFRAMQQSFSQNAHKVSAEEYVALINPSLGEKVLFIGEALNLGKYLRKRGAEVKIVTTQGQDASQECCIDNTSCEVIAACSQDTLPFREGYFDKVVVREAMMSSHNHRRMLQEVFRVLKSGGQVLITQSTGRRTLALLRRLRQLLQKDPNCAVRGCEFQSLLEAAGFKGIMEWLCTTHFVYVGSKEPLPTSSV